MAVLAYYSRLNNSLCQAISIQLSTFSTHLSHFMNMIASAFIKAQWWQYFYHKLIIEYAIN